MSRSTFSGFITARLAMAASQHSIDITGHNIANMHNEGFTRQRLDISSFHYKNGDILNTGPASKIGFGVHINGVSQIRDPFLDVQYRRQIVKVGTADSRQDALNRLGDIFDETDQKALKDALSALSSSLDQKTAKVGTPEFDSIVRSRCQVLVNFMHQKATDLKNVRENSLDRLEKSDIPTMNSLLADIGNLNQSIWQSQVQGNPALELMDQRNRKFDELSAALPVSITYQEVSLSSDTKLSYPVITFTGEGGTNYHLTAGEHGEKTATFSMERKPDGTAAIFVVPADSPASAQKIEITDKLKEGTLKGAIDVLNRSGELDIPPTDFRGIGYYEKYYNSFVQTFANTFNTLNSPNGTSNYLFATSDGSSVFTAANIKITDAWMNNQVHVINSHKPNAGTTENDNLLLMKDALDAQRDFKYEYTFVNSAGAVQTGSIIYYTGSFYQSYSNLENTQGIDASANQSIAKNHLAVLERTSANRDAISGVHLDEEVISMMQYQKSYSAAARLMTTLDQALETLLHNTGVVGR